MMSEKIIKSTKRVKENGEVFTPNRIVKLMLDQPEIKSKIHDLFATFLEPAAGEGAFLVELLKQKLEVALTKSNSVSAYNRNCLIALASLYGIEYLEDNVEMLVMNMITAFNRAYIQGIKTFDKKPSYQVLDSAKVIIRTNMAQGDTLKHINADGDPILFSEWKRVKGKPNWVQRTEYTFESIINESGPTNLVAGETEELDLFADSDFFSEEPLKPKLHRYKPCKWIDIYKQEVE